PPVAPSRLLLVGQREGHVDPVGVVDAARRVRQRDDLGAVLGDELREVAPDVPEALDGDPQRFERAILLRDSLADAVVRATGCRLQPAGAGEPRRLSALPVRTPSTEWPLFIEYVSKIHAITRGSVPTSGAGMSFSGPISLRSGGRR